MSYAAIVARVHTRPHPKADRLQLGTCAGHQVVVGMDTQDGELGVFFPADGQLSEQMVISNCLYSEAACRKLGITTDPTFKYGFFSDKRRVRAQSFRGEKSDGFWCPLSYFSWADMNVGGVCFPYNEGETFTSLDGHEICRKYETPATIRARNQPGRKQRENRCFPKHDVSKQFRYFADAIPSDAVLYLTEKLHGTSGRYGLVLDDVELSLWKRLFNRILAVFPTREYRYLNGSKNVILEKTTGAGYYGTNAFRYEAIASVTLHKGEILYFEIVGDYTVIDGDRVELRPIMDPQPIKDDLKQLRKQYGDTMRYRYGQPEGTAAIYVYKIVHVNEDGVTIDLPWPQVKARCSELGLKHVPDIGGPFIGNEFGSTDGLANIMNDLVDGPSTLDQGHIREGVVLRVESTRGIEYLKHKSWTFGVLEGYIKDSDTYVDTEEAS